MPFIKLDFIEIKCVVIICENIFRSYVIPDDLENLRKVWPKHASRCTKWIVKPPASARGTGISIVNKWSQFPKDRPLVVQK